MPPRTLNWPRRIAGIDRIPLTNGHGSFCLRRVHLGDDAFDRQRIQLGGHLLVLAREGSLILDGENCSLLLQEGDAALIPPGRFAMTEIPRPGFTRGETLLYFFNQRALADLVAAREGVDAVVAKIALPALEFYPVRQVTTILSAGLAANPSVSLTDLRAVFTALLNSGAAMAFNFLKHRVFVPRFQLCLFLENHLKGKVDLNHIASRYPHGARAFRQDCANYLGLPVDQWIFRRRIELAQAWLRYTDLTEHEAAARLGYIGLCKFRGDMKRFGHFSPLELKTLKLIYPRKADRASWLPFWFPSSDGRAEKERQSANDFCTIAMEAKTRSAQQALLRKYPENERQPLYSPGELYPSVSPTTGAEGGVLEEQRIEPDNVITWEAFEKWRTGEFSLGSEIPAFAAAA